MYLYNASGLGVYAPQNWVAPQRLIDARRSAMVEIPQGWGGSKGMGCCNRCNDKMGMSGLTMDGTGLLGTGLFQTPFDFSTWGIGEYAAAGLALWVLYSVFATSRDTYQATRKRIRGARR